MEKLNELARNVTSIQITDAVDILLVATLFYLLFSMIKGTRSAFVLRGLISLIFIGFFVYLIASFFNLLVLRSIFKQFWIIGILLFIIVFNPEIRRALAFLGQTKILGRLFLKEEYIDEIVKAVIEMSAKRIGGLIVFENETSLKSLAETGIEVDSKIKSEVIRTIFTPNTPLHDGAVLIVGERIDAVGCIITQLTKRTDLSEELGTRHRAALGLTEETDAITVVVSEETGTISYVRNGRMTRNLNEETLRRVLIRTFSIEKEEYGKLER
jgi:diadenylate cyclase